jgi:virginiamycin B lyase
MRLGTRSLVVALVALLVAAPGASAYIYWGEWQNGGAVGRAALDGTGTDGNFIPGGPTYSNARGVAVNANHLFWGNNLWSASGTFIPPRIGRSDLTGANVNPSFTGSTGQALTGMAVDATHIYWSSVNQDNGGVGRTPIVGGQQFQAIESTFGAPNPKPCGVASDGTYLYWANQGTNSIGRAELAHWGEVGHVEGNWLPLGPETSPCGVAVTDTHVYWGVHQTFSPGNAVAAGQTIGRAKKDGSEATNAFLGGGNRVTGVAVQGDFIYWSNYGTGAAGAGSIGRGTLTGGGENQHYVSGIDAPWGVAVDGAGPAPLPPQENPPQQYIPPLLVVQPGGSGSPPAPLRAPDFSRVWSAYEVFAPAPWNTRLVVGGVKSSRAVPRGTVWNYILPRAATVTIAIQRRVGGRKRFQKVVTLRRRGKAGRNKVPFSARIRGKALEPGSYRAVFVSKVGKSRSKPKTLAFRIVWP